MSRNRPVKKLSNSPLVLVLCQVRFSPLTAMEQLYIHEILDKLRRAGYKLNESKKVKEIAVSEQGPKIILHTHWECQTLDRTSSVVVNPGFVVFQTTNYDVFEQFLPKVLEAVEIIDDVVSGIVVQRVGLRYINLIQPTPQKKWQNYLRQELHGISSANFRIDTVEQIHQTAGLTSDGKMVLRILQNRTGASLPPDLAVHNLVVPPHARDLGSELATIVDIDHFKEGLSEDFSSEKLSDVCWSLKNGIRELFEDSIATEEAMEIWK